MKNLMMIAILNFTASAAFGVESSRVIEFKHPNHVSALLQGASSYGAKDFGHHPSAKKRLTLSSYDSEGQVFPEWLDRCLDNWANWMAPNTSVRSEAAANEVQVNEYPYKNLISYIAVGYRVSSISVLLNDEPSGSDGLYDARVELMLEPLIGSLPKAVWPDKVFPQTEGQGLKSCARITKSEKESSTRTQASFDKALSKQVK